MPVESLAWVIVINVTEEEAKVEMEAAWLTASEYHLIHGIIILA